VINETGGGNAIVEIPATTMTDGSIEVDVAGQPESGASEGARGFIGLAFRVEDESHFDCFYIRPTNGRADDQVRRNHATQYVSLPDFQALRLRAEAPGMYESYVDLVPGEWTHLRVDVVGQSAKFYVNAATEPTLVVNDLKGPAAPGRVGLWIGDETDGYFSQLKVAPREPQKPPALSRFVRAKAFAAPSPDQRARLVGPAANWPRLRPPRGPWPSRPTSKDRAGSRRRAV